jgi:thiol:disulfide interchange protein DsbD
MNMIYRFHLASASGFLRVLILCASALALACLAVLTGQPARAADFMEPERAFRVLPVVPTPQGIELHFSVEPGYYLYREKLHVEAEGATLGTPDFPPGKVKFDTTFQKDVETYRSPFVVKVPVSAASAGFRLRVGMQGCADAGLCYPPMTAEFLVTMPSVGQAGVVVDAVQAATPAKPLGLIAGLSATGSSAGADGSAAVGGAESRQALRSEADRVEELLRGGSWWATVGAFWLMGLLLSFTPCVLPMLPILSSVIAGGGAVSRARGLGLATAYALGMALVYTGMGVAAGLAGEGLAAALQKPWVLGFFAALLAGLALSMFDVYELQLPSAVAQRLDGVSRRLPGGRLLGVFAMGALSALIVSPCVTAPLAGTLVFLGKTHDVVLAGSALFAMAAGMSVPLLILGASAGRWLPRSGPWMVAVKRFFGFLLLGVALWTVQAVLPAALVLLAWSALLLFAGASLRPFDPHPHAATPRVGLQRAAGLASLIWGVLLAVGAAAGGSDALRPLAAFANSSAVTPHASAGLGFNRVRSVAELDAALEKAGGRLVMLDFYADWCTSCKEMERYTFSDARVQARLASALLLQADVTANTDDDKALLKRFSLFGPPGTIFFGDAGQELPGSRVVGFQSADDFLQTLKSIGH